MTTKTTPTGIPVVRCTECRRTHPESRSHCIGCGVASIFISDGRCLTCRDGGCVA